MQQLALDFDVEPAPIGNDPLPTDNDPLSAPGALVMVQLVPFATWHDSRRARRDRRLLLAAPSLRFDNLLLASAPNLWHEPQYCSGSSKGLR
jgi:hypothetical protein